MMGLLTKGKLRHGATDRDHCGSMKADIEVEKLSKRGLQTNRRVPSEAGGRFIHSAEEKPGLSAP